MRVEKVDPGPLYVLKSGYYSPALVNAAKAVPGMSYDGAIRGWIGYPDAIAATVARLRHEGLRIDDSELPEPDGWKDARSPFLFATSSLRPYQVDGVRFLIARAAEGALLADGMRLGKTAQSITAARAFKQHTLVVCPSHVVGVWARHPKTPPEAGGPGEIAKWWPDAWKPDSGGDDTGSQGGDLDGVCVLESVKPFKAQETARKLGAKSKRTEDESRTFLTARAEIVMRASQLRHAKVIVCHYDILYAWVDVLREWGIATFIIDEVHAVSGWKSRRAAAVAEIAGISRRRIGLSGTPLTNRPRDLHNVLNILAPNRFGYFFAGERQGTFARLYCAAHQQTVGNGVNAKVVWNFDGNSNLDVPDGKAALTVQETLHARLQYMMLRRVKSQVDDQLPDKTRQIVDVAIPARHIVAPSMQMLTGGTPGKEMRRCLDLAADGKLKHVIELVRSHVEEGEKVLCFCYRRRFAEAVADAVGGSFVHGGVPQSKRDERIAKLRAQKGPGVLCATIDTTSTGIDLSFASVAVVAELTWEPHELAQMEERLYRFGAGEGKRKNIVQYVIARGTGDELILRGVVSKLDQFERAIGPTGDRMKEDLGAKRQEDALAALRKTLLTMADEDDRPSTVKKKKKAKG